MIRELLLGELDAYVRDGRFPKNRDFPWQMPVFVDGEGTRCAMAHLMEMGGAASLVEEIHERSNFAFLRELALVPAVAQWLEAAGLTVDEAALIQPTYCAETFADCLCNAGWRAPYTQAVGVLEATITASGTARVDVVHGDGLGHQVGDVISVGESSVGSTMLVPLTARDAKPDAGVDAGPMSSFDGVVLGANGRPTRCEWGATVKELPVSKQQVTDALQAKSCPSYMGAVDARWSQPPPCSSGCNASGEPGSASIAILIAVVGSVVAMRRLRTR